MANYTQFPAQTNKVVPQKAAATYNTFAIREIKISANNPDPSADELVAEFRLARDVQKDGKTVKELIPETHGGMTAKVIINDLFSVSDGDPTLASALNVIFDKIKEVGVTDGIFKA